MITLLIFDLFYLVITKKKKELKKRDVESVYLTTSLKINKVK